MRITIAGARVIDPASQFDQIIDLHIDGGLIHALGDTPQGFVAAQTIDARGLIASPGLVDLDVKIGRAHV